MSQQAVYNGTAELIEGPDDRYILADSEEDARAFADYDGGFGDAYTLRYVGWMCRVAYPEEYDSREEWEESLDFCDDWWEGCAEPVNDRQRAHARQAWEVAYG
jgi:hypothetical protein